MDHGAAWHADRADSTAGYMGACKRRTHPDQAVHAGSNYLPVTKGRDGIIPLIVCYNKKYIGFAVHLLTFI